MVASSKLIDPRAGGGWEELRVKGAARVGDLAVWARNGSVSSVLGSLALLGDLTSHAVQAGFNGTPAMHHMVFNTRQRNIVEDDEAVSGFTAKVFTSQIPAGSVLYIIDYTENEYLFTGNASDVDANGYVTFTVAAGQMNLYQDGIHSVIGIIDPPGATKPIIFEFWFSRHVVSPPMPTDLKYNGVAFYNGAYKYGANP